MDKDKLKKRLVERQNQMQQAVAMLQQTIQEENRWRASVSAISGQCKELEMLIQEDDTKQE